MQLLRMEVSLYCHVEEGRERLFFRKSGGVGRIYEGSQWLCCDAPAGGPAVISVDRATTYGHVVRHEYGQIHNTPYNSDPPIHFSRREL